MICYRWILHFYLFVYARTGIWLFRMSCEVLHCSYLWKTYKHDYIKLGRNTKVTNAYYNCVFYLHILLLSTLARCNVPYHITLMGLL